MPKFGFHQSSDANFSLADITYTERCFCFSANNTLPSTTRAHIIIIIWWTPERGGLTTFPSRHRLGQQVGLLIRAWNRYKTMGPLTICYSSPKHRTASIALCFGCVGMSGSQPEKSINAKRLGTTDISCLPIIAMYLSDKKHECPSCLSVPLNGEKNWWIQFYFCGNDERRMKHSIIWAGNYMLVQFVPPRC